MDKKVFLCVGGDARQIYMCRSLAEHGKVFAYKIFNSAESSSIASPRLCSLSQLSLMPCKADVLVLPMMSGGLDIPSSSGERADCRELAEYLADGAVVTGGRLGTEVIEYFSALGFDVYDYFKREELVIRNCIPTAEGALQIAMQEMAVTVCGSRVLIIGYGRVAKACSRLFLAAGADVACTARRLSALADAENNGCRAFLLGELYGRIDSFDLIINTVPHLILDKAMLSAAAKDAVIIDLASAPGGVDQNAAAALNKRCIHALSLPGKVAPITAGEIIAKTVINIINERKGVE